MKSRSLLLSLLGVMLTLPQASAQFNVYHPFPDSGAVWGMNTGCLGTQCGDWGYIQNYMAGDTMITGNNYKKIQETYLAMSNNGCCSPPFFPGQGFLREDTVARKVYWRKMQWDVDSLLYDFTLDVGDTLRGYLAGCSPTTRAVVSVDSILVGSSYRKRINFDTTSACIHYYMIEGVGSSAGLTACYSHTFMEEGVSLKCYTVGGDLLYLAPCGPPDLMPCGVLPNTVTDVAPTRRKGVRVSPNPASDQLEVELDEDELPAMIAIFDLSGKELMQKVVTVEQMMIDVSWLAAGTYFIRSKSRVATFSFAKIIKN